MTLGIFAIFYKFKAVDFATVFSIVPYFTDDKLTLFSIKLDLLTTVSFLLFIGAVGKSARLGLHTWLPDAMEGPTPVSALIHAATMVTAGVFLIARSSPIYEYTPQVLSIVALIGASTALFAATVGLLQNDLKRVIAYSTCSQLGYMIFACGLSNYSVGIFHLANHAFFKALLFLGAGSVIHAVNDEQDMRKLGGLKRLVPFTYSIMMIGSLALMGFPFLTGFYSKDVILEVAYGKYTTIGHYSYVLGTLGAFLTAFYSMRLLYLTFLAKPNGYRQIICNAYDSSYQIITALICLSIPSIFAGYFLKDMFIGLGSSFWGNSLFVLPQNQNMIDAEFIIHSFKILPLVFSLSGAFLSYLLYTNGYRFLFQLKLSKGGNAIYQFLNKKWFFDKVYNELIGQSLFTFGYRITYKTIDRGIFETIGPKGLSTMLTQKATVLSRFQTGFIYHYTFLTLVFITLFLGSREFWLFFNYPIDFRIFLIFGVLVFFLQGPKIFYKKNYV